MKTPVSGQLKIIDKEKGKVAIVDKPSSGFISQLTGIVHDVTTESVQLQISGLEILGKEGRGHPVYGKIFFLPPDTDVLNLNIDIEDCILVVKHAESSVVAKADTLGAVAIIAESLELPDFTLPYLTVTDISALSRYNEKIVVVYGNEKQLLIVGND